MTRVSPAAVIAASLVSAVIVWGPRVVASGARSVQAAPDALAIIVHKSNPVDSLTASELRRIFLLETQTWPNGRKITLVLREKGQPERAAAIELVCQMSEAAFDRHVLFQTFQGTIGWGPRAIESAGAMLRFVFNVPGAIGYVPADQVDDSTKVVLIDGLLPGDSKYPLRRQRRESNGR